MKVYDTLLSLYVRATLQNTRPQKYTTAKAPEPEQVEMPPLWLVMIVPVLILIVTALVF